MPAVDRRDKGPACRWPAAVIFLVLGLLWSLTLPSPALPASEVEYGLLWHSAHDLVSPRQEHTATLLPNGKVLVAGGFDSTYLKSCELYDPASDTWTLTGEMATERYEHTATLLPNGKVLVVGGFGLSGALNSAELYDPATENWSPAGTFTEARLMHTATLLANGKVLVVGGRNSSGIVASAQLYTPDSGAGSWSSAGTMGTPRNQHTATLLQDGTVLVAGGDNAGVWLDTSQIYTPDSGAGTWSSPSTFPTGRMRHTATCLTDGRVLLAGGEADPGNTYPTNAPDYNPAGLGWEGGADMDSGRSLHTATLLPDGTVLLAGGFNDSAMDSVVAFDPNGWAFYSLDSLATPRYYHTATLLANGKVLVVGGRDAGGNPLKSCEVCDYLAAWHDQWAETGSLNLVRYAHSATLLPNGQVLVAGGVAPVGGEGGNSNTGSTELFDPTGGEGNGGWTASGSPGGPDPLNTPRSSHSATLLPSSTAYPQGAVLVAGGSQDESGDGMAESERYDVATGIWHTTGPLNTARYWHTATLLANGQVLAAGGWNGVSDTASAELFTSDGLWTAIESMSQARDSHTATLLPNGRVLVAGGYYYDNDLGIDHYLTDCVLFDPATGHWTATGELEYGRYGHTATLLPNGKVLVAGGYSDENRYMTSSALYDPATGEWTPTGDLINGRFFHRATLLTNGKVLVSGGYGDDGYFFAECELYDPATGEWTETHSLYTGPQGRGDFTATLLPSGQVLAAGGMTYDGITNDCQLYDPRRKALEVPPDPESWRPVIGYINGQALTPPTLTPGNRLTLTGGSQFMGLSGASGGGTRDSATNYPLVQLRRLDSERTIWLIPNGSNGAAFSATAFESAQFQDFQTGYCLVTVFANGIPSESKFILFNNIGPPTAVKLKSFTAAGKTGYVQLNWQTGAEVDTVAFRLWRREGAQGDYVANQALIPARGGPSRGAKYAYQDTAVTRGSTYYYQLEDIARTGADSFHGPVAATVRPVQKGHKQAQPATATTQETVVVASPAPEPAAPATPEKVKHLLLR